MITHTPGGWSIARFREEFLCRIPPKIHGAEGAGSSLQSTEASQHQADTQATQRQTHLRHEEQMLRKVEEMVVRSVGLTINQRRRISVPEQSSKKPKKNVRARRN